MSSEQVKVEIKSEGGEVIVRHGDAAPVILPEQVCLTGNIGAPREWLTKRMEKVDKFTSNLKVSISSTGVTIVFRENESYDTGTSITGTLKPASELSAFGINQDKHYSPIDLSKLLRKNLWLVAEQDKEKFKAAIESLSKFKAKIDREIEQAQNEKGDRKSLDEVKLNADLPLFILNCPVFAGEAPVRFTVNVGATVTTGVNLFLYSDELYEIVGTERGKIIEREITPFNAAGIPVIIEG